MLSFAIMTVCTFENNARWWFKFLQLAQHYGIWHQPLEDKNRQAQFALKECLDHLQDKEKELKSELRELAVKAKAEKSRQTSAKLRQVLTASAAKRNTLTLTSRKRMALEQQLEALTKYE